MLRCSNTTSVRYDSTINSRCKLNTRTTIGIYEATVVQHKETLTLRCLDTTTVWDNNAKTLLQYDGTKQKVNDTLKIRLLPHSRKKTFHVATLRNYETTIWRGCATMALLYLYTSKLTCHYDLWSSKATMLRDYDNSCLAQNVATKFWRYHCMTMQTYE